jgi:hypothetical protein
MNKGIVLGMVWPMVFDDDWCGDGVRAGEGSSDAALMPDPIW